MMAPRRFEEAYTTLLFLDRPAPTTHSTPICPLLRRIILSKSFFEKYSIASYTSKMARIKYVPAKVQEKTTACAPPPKETPPSASNPSPDSSPLAIPPVASSMLIDPLIAAAERNFALDFAKREVAYTRSVSRRDFLLQLPPKNHTYVYKDGVLKIHDGRFDQPKSAFCRSEVLRKRRLRKAHPKVAAARANWTLTQELEDYYMNFEFGTYKGAVIWHHVPLAGKPRAVCFLPGSLEALPLPFHVC